MPYPRFGFCQLTKQHCFTGTADWKNANNALNDFSTHFGSLLVDLRASCMQAHIVCLTACRILCMYIPLLTKKEAPQNKAVSTFTKLHNL